MKKIVSALLFCALLLSLAACSQKSPTAQETEPESSAARTVTDSFGREVTIPAEVKAIVCTGSGALRMVTYLQCTDRLVGVEDCDKEYADSTLRDYAYVYHDTFDALPSIGKGGGTANTAYVEELIRLQPDVILSGYTQEALEDLAQSTGIPCVSIRAKSINFIDDSFYTAMRVAAEVLGVQERCEEVLQYIDGCKADLDARTADIPDEGKPAVYAGAVTFSGAHGFTGTYSNFGPLMAIHANNVADEMGETGYFDARVTGLNAGSTAESGYYAASAVGSETLHYVIVVLGAAEVDGKNLAYTYTSQLAGYALSRFGYIEVIKDSGAVCELPVTLSSTADYVALVPASTLTLYLPLATDVDTELVKTVRLDRESLEAPVEAGQVVGVYSVSRDGELLGSVELVTKNALPRSEFLVVLQAIEDFTTGVFFLSTCAAAVVLTLAYFLIRALLRRRAGRRSAPRHFRSR